MKKITITIVVGLLIFSLAACGRRQETTPTTTATQPTTIPFLPDMDPTLDTNIPDPHINTEMPTYTDGTAPMGDMLPDMAN